MKRVLHVSKWLLQGLKRTTLVQSTGFWQKFAVFMLILGVVIPTALQAKTMITHSDDLYPWLDVERVGLRGDYRTF